MARLNISHKTLCNKFENGELKHVELSSKIISLQRSRLRELCDEDFHEWKRISSHLFLDIYIFIYTQLQHKKVQPRDIYICYIPK